MAFIRVVLTKAFQNEVTCLKNFTYYLIQEMNSWLRIEPWVKHTKSKLQSFHCHYIYKRYKKKSNFGTASNKNSRFVVQVT